MNEDFSDFDDQSALELSKMKFLNLNEVNFENTINTYEPLNSIISNKSFKSFDQILYEEKYGKKNVCGDYVNKTVSGKVMVNDLLAFIRLSNSEPFFNPYAYVQNTSQPIYISSTTWAPATQYSYKQTPNFDFVLNGQIKSAFLDISLNSRACHIDVHEPILWYNIDPKEKTITYRLSYMYNDALNIKNSNQNSNTDIDADYKNLNDKYKAIIINTSNADAFSEIMRQMGYSLSGIHSEITYAFVKALTKTNNGAELKFIYENAPNFVIKQLLVNLGQDLLWQHVELLTQYDDTGILSFSKDSSSALLNLLKTFNNSNFIFQQFKNNQTLVKRIFENMDNTSVLNGIEWSNKTLFANFITALCIDNAFEDLRILNIKFTMGKNYAISSGSFFQEEDDDNFFLQQMMAVTRKETEIIPDELPSKVLQVEGEKTSLEAVGKGYLYRPMDIVQITYDDDKENPIVFVSAMTLKAYAEERDEQLRADAIRIGFDVLAIVLGVVFFPAGGAVGIMAESIGIGLALADIGITAKREDIMLESGGKEFLENWQKVYFAGGLSFAALTIVEQVFAKSVFCYLNALKKSSPLLEAYEKSLGKILLEREILTFAGNTLKPNTEISLKVLSYNSDKISKATAFTFGSYENLLPLYEKGAILVEIGEQEYALVYKGEKLIQGTSNDKKVLEFYRKLKKSQKRLEEFLEEVRYEGGAFGSKSIVETTDAAKVKAFEEGLKQFSKTIANPFEKIKEAISYFNHHVVGNIVEQVGKDNCGNVAKVIAEYLRTGELKLAEDSLQQGLEKVAEKCGAGRFSDITGLDRLEFLLRDDEIAILYGATKYHSSGLIDGHYLVAVKVEKKVYLLEGQTGEILLYDKTSIESKNFERSYRQFKYTKAGKIKN